MPRPMMYADGMNVTRKITHTTIHISRWRVVNCGKEIHQRHADAVRGVIQHGGHQKDLADAERDGLVELERFFVERRGKVNERGIHNVDVRNSRRQAADAVENPRPLAKAA